MNRVTTSIVGLALATAAAACGGKAGSLGPAPGGSPASPSQPASPAPSSLPPSGPLVTPSPSGRQFTFQVWLTREGKLFVTRRTEPFTVAVAGLALQDLLAGPTAAESTAGVGTAIPGDSTLHVTAIAAQVATVDADPGFFQGGGGDVTLRRGQVVYSLTQYSTIRSVRFTAAGATTDGKAYAPQDFAGELPAIVVESPSIGDRVTSPVTVSGTANVFEATVSVRILDAGGNEIAHTFTQATCGTGCRGDYSTSISYDVGFEQQGTIEVFETSAKDGSRINVVDIPVTLSP